MATFLEGAKDAGKAAAAALFGDLQRQWQLAVAQLDTLLAHRADLRGVTPQTAARAQDEALNALTDEFDRLLAEWAELGDIETVPDGEHGNEP